jgi:glycosyltransferase involved in cell wall biosynthesis
MKVALANSYYPPWIGGAETYVSNLAKALANRGHNVTVYCADRPVRSGQFLIDGVKIVRMTTPVTLYGTPITMFPSSILSENYDVLHSNFPSPFIAAFIAALSRFTNTPAVLTWHNDLPPVTSTAGLLIHLHNLFADSYLSTYRSIIATTEVYTRLSSLLRRYGHRVCVIPNGVDTLRFNPQVEGESVRAKHNLRGCLVVLFVGALTIWHSYKGVDLLLRSFGEVAKKYDTARLLIVGSGSLMPTYERLANELSLGNKVVFAGNVAEEQLANYYAASDVFVLPSKDYSEGYGLVLLEAMASGKPVVGSAVGGIVDVISHGKTGLLAMPSSASLSDALVELLTDEDRRLEMGNNGRRFAETRDWSIIARKTEEVYERISH